MIEHIIPLTMKYKPLLSFIAIIAMAGGLLVTFNVGSSPQTNKFSESSGMLGHIELVAKDSDGNIKAYRQTDNIIVNVGKSCAAIHIFGVPTGSNGTGTACGGQLVNPFNLMAIGTSTTAAQATDTALVAQVGSRVNNGTMTLINSTANAPYVILQDTFRPNAAIAEAGIFDSATGGHMFARQQFTPISLGATDTLTVTWRISLN